MLVTVIGNYHEGTIPHAKVRRHEADAALKEMEQLVFSRDQYQKDAEELRKRLAELVCPECDSRIMDNGYCMMGHWCGKPLK